jgi:iron complex transport system substrate-binding protein
MNVLSKAPAPFPCSLNQQLYAWMTLVRQSFLLMLICLTVSISAVSAQSLTTITVHDDRDVELNFSASPQRIISLLPSATESVCALDACKRLVGTDQFSNSPPEVIALPKLGGLEDAQIERIVALKPDVVLAAKSARVTERLESLGLKVVVLESQTHVDVKRTLTLVARLLGTPEKADRVWAQIDRDIKLAAARVPAALRGKKVYFEVASAPYAAGASSFIGETLTRLGIGNIVPPELGPFPKLNPEFIIRAQPDIIMATEREVKQMAGRPGWRGLTALRKRSCGFAADRYELLIRPGPRMGEAALAIADCLVGLRMQTIP